MRLLSAASDPCPASSQNTRTHHVATSNRAAVACISRTHTTSHKHTHTQHASPTRRSHNTAYGDRLPLILSSAALTWTSLSSSLYNHHQKNTRHTHTNTSRLFCPSATSLLSLLSFSRPLFIPLVALQNLQTSRQLSYSLFPIVSMYTLLLLLSFVVSFSRREPLPPLTTSASAPSPPPTSASPPSPPPPP